MRTSLASTVLHELSWKVDGAILGGLGPDNLVRTSRFPQRVQVGIPDRGTKILKVVYNGGQKKKKRKKESK